MIRRATGMLVAAICAVTQAASPHREPVSFSYEWDVGLGRSVYVVGNHPDVGSWNPLEAVRLYWTPGNVWTGQLAVQAGTALEYKYIARINTQSQHCEMTNVVWMGDGPNLERSISAQPDAPYTGKTIYYLSSWTNAFILYKVGTNFVDSAAMEQMGSGRVEGESLYRISGIGETGEPIEFVPHGYLDGVEYWDNAPYPGYGDDNYHTTLDVFHLQDGHVFNYRPPANVSAPSILVTNVASSVAGIPGRDVRIYLPRGYEENTWKRYPVLYMHDGQNIFHPGGAFGSWDVDFSATREIGQGRVREAIIVGMDNNTNRLAEYSPPGDAVQGNAGIGDAYMDYVVNHVRPTIDTHFRTLNDPPNTLVAGSSMGGLISTYMGLEGAGVFGKVGAFSPSYWAASNLVAWIESNDTKGVRFYLDGGTGEGSSIWQIWTVYDHLLRDGYAPNADLKMVIGCGQGHDEPAWAARFPEAMRYLLSVWDEANLLMHEEAPLRIEHAALTLPDHTFQVAYYAFSGWSYRLERTTSLTDPSAWQPVVASGTEPLPWTSATLTVTNMPDSASYRLIADAPSFDPP